MVFEEQNNEGEMVAIDIKNFFDQYPHAALILNSRKISQF
jgi:hypothetical protein